MDPLTLIQSLTAPLNLKSHLNEVAPVEAMKTPAVEKEAPAQVKDVRFDAQEYPENYRCNHELPEMTPRSRIAKNTGKPDACLQCHLEQAQRYTAMLIRHFGPMSHGSKTEFKDWYLERVHITSPFPPYKSAPLIEISRHCDEVTLFQHVRAYRDLNVLGCWLDQKLIWNGAKRRGKNGATEVLKFDLEIHNEAYGKSLKKVNLIWKNLEGPGPVVVETETIELMYPAAEIPVFGERPSWFRLGDRLPRNRQE